MTGLLDILLRRLRVDVPEDQRGLVLRDGRIDGLLGPGRHLIRPRRGIQVRPLRIDAYTLDPVLETALFRDHPDLAARHLTVIEARAGEVVLVSRNGRPEQVLRPGERQVRWTEAARWEIERFAAAADRPVPAELALRLIRVGLAGLFTTTEVPEGHVALVTMDGGETIRLTPGLHRYWVLGQKLVVRLVDLRWKAHDVAGQEILTRDRVSLRVTLAATYRIADAERVLVSVKDHEEALHRALQLAFRRTLGALTLDQLLADKVSVDAGAADLVRAEMAGHGIEVGEIALKDIVLPGEMRALLNRVVEAQKEAEANMIRRREETNATRSLLNTAKVIEENPIMLRLRELETLEALAGKIGTLTVHNGNEGLLTDLVRLRG